MTLLEDALKNPAILTGGLLSFFFAMLFVLDIVQTVRSHKRELAGVELALVNKQKELDAETSERIVWQDLTLRLTGAFEQHGGTVLGKRAR